MMRLQIAGPHCHWTGCLDSLSVFFQLGRCFYSVEERKAPATGMEIRLAAGDEPRKLIANRLDDKV